MDTVLYIFVLSVAVIFASISYFINSRLVTKTASQAVLRVFLLFFIFHCSFIAISKFFFSENTFLSLGSPFMVFYGPFFHITLNALQRQFSGNKKENTFIIIHFIPAFVFIVLYLYILNIGESNIDIGFLINYYLIMYVTTGVIVSGYAIYGYIVINRLSLSYRFRVLIIQVICVMLFMAIMLIGLVTYNAIPDTDYDIVYFGMLLLSFFIFRFYTKRVNNKSGNDVAFVVQESKEKFSPAGTDVVASIDEGAKYEKSKVPDELLMQYRKRVDKVLFEDRMFLESDFSIERLEELTGISRHHLSQVFTLTYHSNFKPYVNKLRINHAMELIATASEDINISELGEQCGFNSRTSFFRSFKKNTGVSPSDYIDQHKQQQK